LFQDLSQEIQAPILN